MNRKLLDSKPLSLLAAILLTVMLALSNSACNTARAKADHIERGESFLAERKFPEAALEFRSAIELDKNFAAAHFGLAKSYEGQLRLAETVDELRRTVDLDKNHAEARVKLGNYLLLAQPPQIEEVERLVREIFAVNPNHVEGYILQASLFTLQNKPEAEVLAILEKAIALDPARVESYLGLARFYVAREKMAEAERTFARALEVNPNSSAAHIEFARFLDLTNRTQEAEKHYARAVELAPKDREPLEAIAGFYLAHKQLDRAEETYKRLANLYPDRPEERVVLADFYAATNRVDEAVRVFNEILAQKPQFIRGRARLGEIYLQGGDYDGANAQVTEILSRNNRDTQGLLLRSRIRLKTGEAEAAVKDLQEVLKQEPSSRLALYYMADAQLKSGQIEQARNFANDLQRYHPDYLFGKLLNTQISFAAGEPAVALGQANELLKALEKAAPGGDVSASSLAELQINALMARGQANLLLGKQAEAKADFQTAQRNAPGSAGVYLNMATAALQAKNSDEAFGFYEKALQLDPKNFDALSGLVSTEISRKNFGAAHERVDRALNAGNSNNNRQAALFYLKSQVFSAEQKRAEAENALQKSIALNAGYLPAYTAYAALLAEQNQIDRAIEKYREMLKHNPNDSGTYVLIGMLEDGRGNLDAAIENYRRALQI
ncbi:MAG TPA: tetratricopeptide repeat protein, partial [Pyrinomonadaceae bacterium]|nr:tetratricopeptide repeat protein [Pyrinomonadaceae bacterium]